MPAYLAVPSTSKAAPVEILSEDCPLYDSSDSLIGFFSDLSLREIIKRHHVFRVDDRHGRPRRYKLGPPKENADMTLAELLSWASVPSAQANRTVYRQRLKDKQGDLVLWCWTHRHEQQPVES